MVTFNRFEEIDSWKAARELTKIIYRISHEGSFRRDFGLRDQTQRAAVSIMANIAEGFESRTRPLFIEFLGRAKASAGELRAHLYVALDAGHISELQFQDLVARATSCSGQISRLITYLQGDKGKLRTSEAFDEYLVGEAGPVDS